MNYPYPKRLSCPITKELQKPKKSKQGNKIVYYQGIKFHSIRERDRYIELKALENLGLIEELELQVPFEIMPSYQINGRNVRAIKYICDFTYYKIHKGEIPMREFVIEDVKPQVKDGKKPYRTEVYKLKKKMFEYKCQTEIKEV